MTKYHYDELTAALDEILEGHDVKSITILVETDTANLEIECEPVEGPVRYPRFDDIHGEVTIH